LVASFEELPPPDVIDADFSSPFGDSVTSNPLIYCPPFLLVVTVKNRWLPSCSYAAENKTWYDATSSGYTRRDLGAARGKAALHGGGGRMRLTLSVCNTKRKKEKKKQGDDVGSYHNTC
jgi:hypothetical protein